MLRNITNKIPLPIKLFIEKKFHNILHFYQPFRCSVCQKKIPGFDPFPPYYKENLKKNGYKYTDPSFAETCNWGKYLCRNCGASDRDRLYFLFLRPLLANWLCCGKSIKILEIAPSKLVAKYLLNMAGKASGPITYRTADLFAAGVDDIVDIMDMKIYADRSFDFFICSHVLEHVPDDMKAMRELYRILKPGGSGILMVPICLAITEIDEDPGITDEAERWRRFGQNDHVRLYSKNSFIDRVKKSGFDLEQLGINYFGKKKFEENGITGQSVLYIVKKSG
jgi:SAM-dependent methyltransferase